MVQWLRRREEIRSPIPEKIRQAEKFITCEVVLYVRDCGDDTGLMTGGGG